MKRRYDGFWVGLLLSTSSAGCPDGTEGTKVVDEDGDGYEEGDDCDDADPDVNPGAIEECGDGVDNDCDGSAQSCVIDDDGDGYPVEDDCDDHDDAVYPEAYESCLDGVDNDCDGISTDCLSATMIYDASATGSADSYGTAVFADRVAFGDPSGGNLFPPVGDGRVAFFELVEDTVSELDADFISAGEVGADGAYGVVVVPLDETLCLSADYHDYDVATADAGKSWCFDEATVRASTGALELGDAQFTTAGQATEAFARTGGEADVDGDGELDLLVFTADGVHVVYGDGTPWSGDVLVPADADVTLGDCAASPSFWCGFGSVLGGNTLAVSGPGGFGDEISLYELPLQLGSTVPTATYSITRNEGDAIAAMTTVWGGFAIGSSYNSAVTFVDVNGEYYGDLDHQSGEMFGYWVDTMTDQDGHELLLVGAPEALFDGTPAGEVFVFDLTANGLPTSSSDATHRLTAPGGFHQCGSRARGGIIRTEGGIETVVTSSCTGSGGAVYVLDSRPLPPPALAASAITQTGPNAYRIRKHVVDAYTSYLPWALGLAQTELVRNAENEIIGWRLHGIANNSPLHRAGLRTGDILRRVNATNVTTPAVVRGLLATVLDDAGATVRISRGGVLKTLTYTVVP